MESMPFITVKHNIEVAHRLYEMPGKCQQIHGHSMWVEMYLFGQLNKQGVLEGLEFGKVKQRFRAYLDNTFDHHLLLNENDPWAQPLWSDKRDLNPTTLGVSEKLGWLPGLMAMPADPTTEHLAKWIAEWAADEWKLPVQIKVAETAVNGASYTVIPFSNLYAAGQRLFTPPQGGTEVSTTSGD